MLMIHVRSTDASKYYVLCVLCNVHVMQKIQDIHVHVLQKLRLPLLVTMATILLLSKANETLRW